MDTELRHNIYQHLDITSLNSTDHPTQIIQWATDILSVQNEEFTPAALCVFPVFIEHIKPLIKDTTIALASVAGGFPDSQTFTHIKVNECEEAIKKGATEIDTVINLNAFFEGNYARVQQEISLIKQVIGTARLKVIIETGVLTIEQTKIATQLAIAGGANFIKTSTGRVAEGATLEKTMVICEEIKAFPHIGIKISGGIKSVAQATTFYEAISSKMGDAFMTPKHFRIGASSLATALRNGN